MNFCFYHPRLLVNSSRLIRLAFHPNCTTHATSRTIRGSKSYASLTGRMESKVAKENYTTQRKIEYMPIEDVEKLERYCPGGYHPVTIGEQLGSKYSIVHKLGFGAYSTIWLAQNQESGKYVAIKIPVAACDPIIGTRETDILRRLNNTGLEGKAHPGAAYIPSILDVFSLSGPNGIHHCYVTEPGMMSLAEAKDASSIRLFQLPVARLMAAQLVQAVAFIHSQGIVHGDLHDGNVLVHLPGSIDSLSPEQFYEKHGSPQYEPVVRLDECQLPQGVPKNVIVPIWLGKESELVALSEAQIILTDFGESFMPAAVERPYSNAPEVLTPPEVYFEERQSFPADIWTLACMIWSIIAQCPLFEVLGISEHLTIHFRSYIYRCK